MAQYGDQHGKRIDEYGNPIGQSDEYGDPVHRPTGVDYGTTGAGGTYGNAAAHRTDPYGSPGGTQQQLGPQETRATIGAIRAEPYLPTGAHATGTTPGSTGPYQSEPDKAAGTTKACETDLHPHEKKGMMEKIKEKLPGHHHNKST